MKEFKPDQDHETLTQSKNLLRSVISQPGPNVKRPCPACDTSCSCSGSKSCACGCSFDCPSLPLILSLDPVKYPVEKNIIPLVFAINSLHACPSYWSCEGHENLNGELVKIPRVSFYSNSTLLPSLIAESLCVMAYKKIIQYRWKVIAVGMTDQLLSQYMIEPDIDLGIVDELIRLQADARHIADNLFSGVKQKAKSKLYTLEKP